MINKILKIDWVIMFSIIFLLGIGAAVLYSISLTENQNLTSGLSIFWRQFIFMLTGLFFLGIASIIDLNMLKKNSTFIYFSTIIILLLLLIFGKTIRGTAGWISFGTFSVQPVEIAKVALIIFLASFISQKKMELEEFGRIIASVILSSIMIFLVLKQPDFGSAMVLVGILFGMTIISGISAKRIMTTIILLIFISAASWFYLEPYQKNRVLSLINPEAVDIKGAGYNVNQSIISVGSGGFYGKGIGHGSQSQLNFLPEKHTDFIFASIAEELGLIGGVAVLFLYGIIFYRIKVIARNAYDNFSYMLAVGIFIMFFVQVVENIGMNIGIMPVTGITLPLLSYGGSSLIVTMISIGILLNIYSHEETIKKDRYFD